MKRGLALVALMMPCVIYGQVDSGIFSKIVDNWLSDAGLWVRSVDESRNDLDIAFTNLERSLPVEIRRSSAWASVLSKGLVIQGGLRTLLQIAQKNINADQEYQRQLQHPGAIEVSSATDNITTRIDFQEAVAENLRQFVRLLNQTIEELRSISPANSELVEFNAAIRALEATNELLGRSAGQFTARAARYAAIRGDIKSAPTSAAPQPISGPQYSTSQRIQISEACPSVAKWLTQALIAGPHWQVARYDSELGTLTFNVVSIGNLTRSDIRQYTEGGSGPVHLSQVVVTLRTLVTSTLSFDGAGRAAGESCAIASAFKFVGKNGNVLYSNGNMEIEFLQKIQKTYAERGLDY